MDLLELTSIRKEGDKFRIRFENTSDRNILCELLTDKIPAGLEVGATYDVVLQKQTVADPTG